MTYQDEEQTRLANEVERRNKERATAKPINDMPNTVKLVLTLGIAILLYFINPFKVNDQIRLLMSGIVVVMIFASTSIRSHHRLLTKREIVSKGISELLFYQQHFNQLPPGKIHFDIVGILVRVEWGGEPYYWEHGFTVTSYDVSDVFYGSIMQDPYSGECIGVRPRDEGFDAKEEPERVWATTNDFRKAMFIRRTQAEADGKVIYDNQQ